ncbi:transposase [Streptomyces sp. HB132]|uniref:transposase n=1 Tax=Streptomyces sp. HB132 TaxID=767388 RepID=UPI0035A92688
MPLPTGHHCPPQADAAPLVGQCSGLVDQPCGRRRYSLLEPAESWVDLLCDAAARRGMRAPVLAVGDGAIGFWKALAQVCTETRHQRCWVHRTANVLNAAPKSASPVHARHCRTSKTPRIASTPSRRSPHSTKGTA